MLDAKILQMIKVVEVKKADLAKTKEQSSNKWITNCSFQLVFGAPGTNVNLNTANESLIREVVKAVVLHQDLEQRVTEILGKSETSRIQGFTPEQWIADCKTRLAKIQISAKTQHLEDLESRLNAVVSPDLRRQMELDALLADETFKGMDDE